MIRKRYKVKYRNTYLLECETKRSEAAAERGSAERVWRPCFSNVPCAQHQLPLDHSPKGQTSPGAGTNTSTALILLLLKTEKKELHKYYWVFFMPLHEALDLMRL